MFDDILSSVSNELQESIDPVLKELVRTRRTVDTALATIERLEARLDRYEQIFETFEPVLNVFRRIQCKPPLVRKP